jgi:hypothetical protein
MKARLGGTLVVLLSFVSVRFWHMQSNIAASVIVWLTITLVTLPFSPWVMR